MTYMEHYARTRDRSADMVEFEELVESVVLSTPRDERIQQPIVGQPAPHPQSVTSDIARRTGVNESHKLSFGADPSRPSSVGSACHRGESPLASRRVASGGAASHWLGWVWLVSPLLWVAAFVVGVGRG